MTLTKFGSVVLSGVVVVASVWMPFVLRDRTRAALNEKTHVLHMRIDQVAQLSAAQQHLSNLVAQSEPAQPISAEQLNELLRLRGRMSRLREQARKAQKLREENQRLQAQLGSESNAPAQLSQADLEERLSAETIEAAKALMRELPAALQRFANEHSNQPPYGFWEIRDYFPVASGSRMTGLYTFEFLRDHLTENGSPQPGDVLILRENQSRSQLGGTHARVYGLSDGTVTEVKLPGDDFDPWEKQHMGSPLPRTP